MTHHLLCHEHEVHEMNDVLYVEFEPAIILGAAEEEAVLRRNSFQPTMLLTGDTEIAPGVEAIALLATVPVFLATFLPLMGNGTASS